MDTTDVAQLSARLEEIAQFVRGLGTDRTAPINWRQLVEVYRKSEVHMQLGSWATILGRLEHIDRILGRRPVAETTIAWVWEYRVQRAQEVTKRGRPTTPATRNREIEYIRRLTRWGSIQIPPLLARDPLAPYKREMFFEEENNIRRNVVEEIDGEPLLLEDLLKHGDDLDRALVLVAYDSGMRRKELACMEHSWIHRGRLIEIPPGITKGRKGRKPGRITITSERALEAIARWREYHRHPVWVFPSRNGKTHLHPDTLTQRFTELQERAGMSGPSGPTWLHDLRRSFITVLVRRGEDTRAVMDLSGHHTLKAFDRYNIRSHRNYLAIQARVAAARLAELQEQ